MGLCRMRRSSLVGLKDFSERKQDLKTKQKKKNEKNDSVMRNCSVKMKKAAGGKQNSLRLLLAVRLAAHVSNGLKSRISPVVGKI